MDASLLMALLAAQTGRSPGTQDYLARAAADGGAGLDSKELLAHLSKDNPQLATMMNLMGSQKSVPPAIESVGVSLEEFEELKNWLESSDKEVQDTKQRLLAAQDELSAIRQRADELAGALGACCLCWGQDPGCRACRGHGSPGRSLPDPALFSQYVIPAVRLMQASRQRLAPFGALSSGPNRAAAEPNSMRHTS